MTDTLVGHVKQIYRYPVKGMRGEELERADLYWHGLQGDRRYALAARDDRSGFPWLTGRLKAELISYVPAFENAQEPNTSNIKVHTPQGISHSLKSDVFLDELETLFNKSLELIKLDRGCFDSATALDHQPEYSGYDRQRRRGNAKSPPLPSQPLCRAA